MVHIMKEKFIQAALYLLVGIGTLIIIFFFRFLRFKEEKEQESLNR